MMISGIKPSLVNTYECISALGPAGKLISGKADFQLQTHLLASFTCVTTLPKLYHKCQDEDLQHTAFSQYIHTIVFQMI